jgi:agmatine deiminase
LTRIIAKYEDICLLAPPDRQRELKDLFKRSDSYLFDVEVIPIEYNDIWVRDTLPTFAIASSGSLIAIDWGFNGWGRRVGPYAQYGKDTQLAWKIAELTRARIIKSGLAVEAGAFAFDGDGAAVATKSVMFDKNRNRGFRREELQHALLKASCCSSICWLPGNRQEAITCGHSDGILSFAPNNVVLFQWTHDDISPDYDVCDYNLRVFQEWADQSGRHYKIVQLSTPSHPHHEYYCSSFVNFAYVNDAVILPTFGEGFSKANKCAQEKIEAAFKGKIKVETLDVQAIAAAGGGTHCVTCHEPAVTK